MRMGIDPVHFDRFAFDAHGLGVVVFGRERMMRRERDGYGQKAAQPDRIANLMFTTAPHFVLRKSVYQPTSVTAQQCGAGWTSCGRLAIGLCGVFKNLATGCRISSCPTLFLWAVVTAAVEYA